MSTRANSKIRAVIVEDEDLARQILREMLGSHPEVEVVAECNNGFDAVKVVPEVKPDLLFLDVQMPECGGFDVLELLGNDLPRVVIFVTAYDRYALRAFEVSAIDYLLKPVAQERFTEALTRAKRRIAEKSQCDLNQNIKAMLEWLRGNEYAEHLSVQQKGRIVLVRTKKIDWIEANGNCAPTPCGRADA